MIDPISSLLKENKNLKFTVEVFNQNDKITIISSCEHTGRVIGEVYESKKEFNVWVKNTLDTHAYILAKRRCRQFNIKP